MGAESPTMRVILAEKPSVARDIARVLGCNRREEGFFQGERDIVTYAVGHLVNLPMPETLNPAWAGAWTAQKLPMIPATWQYVVNPKTSDQFAVVKRLLNARDTTEVVNAADAGREGEAIFRRIYALAGCRKPVSALLGQLPHRRGHPRRLRPPSPRRGLRFPRRLRPDPRRDRLALGHELHPRLHHHQRRPLHRRPRPDPHPRPHRPRARSRSPASSRPSSTKLHAHLPGFVAKALNLLDARQDPSSTSKPNPKSKPSSRPSPPDADSPHRIRHKISDAARRPPSSTTSASSRKTPTAASAPRRPHP